MSLRGPERLKQLAAKATNELKNPRQLLDPYRTGGLVRKAIGSLATVFIDLDTLPPLDPSNIRIDRSDNGLIFFSTDQTRLAGVLFPQGARIYYQRGDRQDFRGGGFDAYITGTTVELGAVGYPDQGYKDDLGEKVALEKRDEKDWVQHGGFLINNNTGQIDFFDFPDLEQKWTAPLSEDEILMQANWRTDSESGEEVARRENMYLAHPYNAIGKMTDRDGSSRLFTINSEVKSLRAIRGRLGLKPLHPVKRDVFMRELVEFADIIKDSEGSARWEMMGLEYTTGGTYFRRLSNDYFGVKLG